MSVTLVQIKIPKTWDKPTTMTRFAQYPLSATHVIEFDLGDTKVEIVVDNQMGLDAVGKLFRDMWRDLEPLITPEEVS